MDGQLDPISWEQIAPDTLLIPPAEPDLPGTELLLAILEELVWFGTLNHGTARWSINSRIRGMRCSGVPYRPRDWFGLLSDRERQRYSRATLWLERDGFVVRIVEPRRDRVAYLQPTVNGLMWAIRRSAEIDETAIIAALRLTDWGQRLADDVEAVFVAEP